MEMQARKLALSPARGLFFEPRMVDVEQPHWSRRGQLTFVAMAGATCWAVPLALLYFLAF
jgi:hypothetical protein